MKKLFLLITMAVAMISFVGCQKNEVGGGDNIDAVASTFELVADIAQTKTTLDGLSVEWEEGDVIYMVTSDETWGKSYANDNPGTSIADFTYADGKFSTSSTIPAGSYTFNAMYVSASQRTYHRGASSSHKLESIQIQSYSFPTNHIKFNDALVGTFTATTPMETVAKVTMNHLYTLMQVDVKNNTGAAMEITKFEMTAVGANLAGVFNVDAFDTPAISIKSAASETIIVDVTSGIVESGESFPVYFVMAPLKDYSGDVTFKVTDTKGNTYSKTITLSGISFEAGEYNTTPYTISTPDELSAKSLPFEETFASSIGEFVTEGELDGLTYVWANDSQYKCAKASAYVSGVRHELTNYLVSPVLDLSSVEDAKLTFEHAGSYFNGTEKTAANVCVREVGGEWNVLDIPNYFTSWTFVESGDISLSSFVGKKIQLGFKYSSTSSIAGTWEVKNLKVVAEAAASEISGVSAPDAVEAKGGIVSIPYAIVNPKPGQSINAMTDVDWITSFDFSTAGQVKFTVSENTSNEARIGVVTLSYNGAESVSVNVSQKGIPVSGSSSVTIDLTAQNFTNQQDVTSASIASGPVTVAFSKGSASNPPKYYTSGSAVRVYGGGSFTVGISSGNIVGVEIIFGSSDGTNSITANVGSFASPNWTGSSSSVTFTVGGSSGNRRIQKLKVTYVSDGTTPEQPILSPRNLAFSSTTANATVGQAFTAPTLSGVTTGVTYTSSDTSVATVNASTGAITLVSAGTTIIKASASETTEYEAGEASYTLTVSPKGDKVTYTLLFGSGYNAKGVSSYTDTWNVTNGGFKGIMTNWNNNNNGWSYVKAGRKNNASVATITTAAAVPEALTTVTMTVDALTASKINSLTLYVSSNANFTTKDTYTATATQGNVVFNISNPVANAYYKIEVDCASGSSNGLITVSKVVYAN